MESGHVASPKTVYWAALPERTGASSDLTHNALLSVAVRAGQMGYLCLDLPDTRTDDARNKLCKVFYEATKNPGDTIVMLDVDHPHPYNVVERLVARDVGVVGALAFRRSEPYDPCFFMRAPEGHLVQPDDWNRAIADLEKGTIVGTGAIAIQRWVFEKLTTAGYKWPWFRFTYSEDHEIQPGEDVYFGITCEQVGVPHYCDFTLETPHQGQMMVGEDTFRSFRARRLANKVAEEPGNGSVKYKTPIRLEERVTA